jgi:hypothetical protein
VCGGSVQGKKPDGEGITEIRANTIARVEHKLGFGNALSLALTDFTWCKNQMKRKANPPTHPPTLLPNMKIK